MTKRIKLLLGVALAAVVISAAIAGDEGGIKLVLGLVLFVWVGWRVFVFLALLLNPVREKLRPYVDPMNAHAHDTLRRSGLGKVADISEKLQAGIDGAVSETQKRIDERRR